MEIKPLVARRRTILLSIVLFSWPVILLFNVPIINVAGLLTYRILFFSALCSWIAATIYAARKELRVVMFLWVVSLLNVISIIYMNGSEKLFLGRVLAKKYVAEAPGYAELTLYSGNNYRVGYGGIFGDTDVFYGKYEINDSIVWIYCEINNAGFHGSMIEINGIRHEIKIK
jgi:hypothetical protein